MTFKKDSTKFFIFIPFNNNNNKKIEEEEDNFLFVFII